MDKTHFPITYAVKHKNPFVREKSRSGGVFTAISDYVIEVGGCVVGCMMETPYKAIHSCANTKTDRDKMRGSKYVQSDLQDTFQCVKEKLQNTDKLVLFSGTTCQIDALRYYLKDIDSSNLICADILCHGVPSPYVLKKYLLWQEEINGSKCIAIDFRNKSKFGWDSHVETLCLEKNDKSSYMIDSEIFKTIFYKHNLFRPACYMCPYKQIYHSSDITLADYWGVEKAAPGFNDNKGVSLILINTQVGESLFKSVREHVNYQLTCIENSMQGPLEKPYPLPNDRNEFWKDFKEKDFLFIAKKYCGYGTINRFKIAIFTKLGSLKRKAFSQRS